MKVLCVVLLSTVLGIASCDLSCMQFKVGICFSAVTKTYGTTPLCVGDNALLKCLLNGAKDCDVENEPVVKDVLNMHNFTCVDGTEMNELFKKHKDCVFGKAAIGNALCLKPLFSAVLRLKTDSSTTTPPTKKHILKVSCNYRESGDQCINNNIKSECGEEAMMFRNRFSAPSIQLSKGACDEISDGYDLLAGEFEYEARQNAEDSVSPNSHHHHYSAFGPHASSFDDDDEYYFNTAANMVSISQNLILALIVVGLLKCSIC
ncbi:uncharacterized protein CEXT_629981 [Caerostris extrusa]|uniref:Uncharacterized protein n=1 Tax=Caerostris extrusa TaxID=172846 RepID=A0AAV4NTL1_CAEEX|nr:uncharacterized protein CEXT_629981 [Caerostris extrusa]